MTIDPMDAATQAGERADTYFGQMSVNATFISLQRGQRPQPWVEGMGEDTRRTEVFFSLNPLDESGMTRLVERRVLAESSEHTRIVWPSLRDLGIKHLRELDGRWVCVEMVNTGRTWTNNEGATMQGTTLKFTAIYDNRAACLAAWESQFGSGNMPSNGAGKVAGNGAGNGNGAAADMKRATAMQFLPALVKTANGDRTLLSSLIAGMPLLAEFFTVDSPEVQALMKETA